MGQLDTGGGVYLKAGTTKGGWSPSRVRRPHLAQDLLSTIGGRATVNNTTKNHELKQGWFQRLGARLSAIMYGSRNHRLKPSIPNGDSIKREQKIKTIPPTGPTLVSFCAVILFPIIGAELSAGRGGISRARPSYPVAAGSVQIQYRHSVSVIGGRAN